jgi:transposase
MDAEPRPFAVIVGVDIGKEHHHAVGLDRSGTRLLDRGLPNDEAKLRTLLTELRQQGPVLVVVDQPASIGALVVAVAQALGLTTAYLPGLSMRRLADAFPGEAKTDARDALVIAETARALPQTLRALALPEAALAELRLLCGFDDDLKHQITATSNRLRGLLTQLQPALERVLGPRLDHPAVLALLQRTPTPQALAALGERRLVTRLTPKAPRLARQVATDIVRALGEQTVVVAGTAAAGPVIAGLAAQLALLRQQRTDLAAQVEALVDAHPLSVVLLSLPGVGSGTAARLLTELGGRTFTSAAQLAAYAGIAPVTRQSGRSVHGERAARGGNKRLKRALYDSAASVIGHPSSQAYYRRKRAEGKHHTQAVLALARRRVDVLYAMLRDGTCYVPPAVPGTPAVTAGVPGTA